MLSDESKGILLERGAIINLNKPVKMTSHDCVAKLRGILGIRKIGHTGTLDPMATGVLPMCIGPATRITEYLDLDFKSYRCAMFLGMNTSTLDIWGEVQTDERSGLRPFFKRNPELVRNRVMEAVDKLQGKITQYPPMYSAVRVDGKRLYEYAREGIEVETKPREVFIKELKLIDIVIDDMVVVFEAVCSKGTYIRSLCADIGRETCWGGCMAELVRTASGIFQVQNAVKFSQIQTMDERQFLGICTNLEEALPAFGKIQVDEARGAFFRNGGKLAFRHCDFIEEPEYAQQDMHLEVREDFKHAYRIYEKGEGKAEPEFLGIGIKDDSKGIIVPDKVFRR